MTKSRKMRKMVAGSIWDSIKSGWNSASQSASNSWNSLTSSSPSSNEKKSTNYSSPTNYSSSSSTNYSSPTNYSNPSPTNYSSPSPTNYSSTSPSPNVEPSYSNVEEYNNDTKIGGKRNRKRRGGGYMDSNLAANAAPFSGSPTAQARWVGGARKRTKKTRKTRKLRKTKKTRKH